MAQQTRNPTGDGTFTGTWTGSAGSRFSLVDDHPDSGGADKLTHGTTAGRGTFTFSAFTVPAAATITNVQVLYYDQKTAAQGASWGAFLRVNGADQATNDAHNPANGVWTLRTATYTNNPATGSPWTVGDVNGSGASPLQGFGVVATDASPTCELASIQLVVNYTEPFIPDEDYSDPVEWQASAARVFAAGALALGATLAGSFNFNEDTPPPVLVETSTVMVERAVIEPTFKAWEFTEELPQTPLPPTPAIDDVGLIGERLVYERAIKQWEFTDEVPTQPVPPTPAIVDTSGLIGERLIHERAIKQWEFTDDAPGIVPPPPVPTINDVGGLVGERLVHERALKQWEFVEDWPSGIEPLPPVPTEVDTSGLIGERLRHERVVKQWEFSDEVPQLQTSGFFDNTSQYAQRALIKTKVFSWDQVDEVPSPTPPDQSDSVLFMAIGEDPVVEPFTTNDDWVPPIEGQFFFDNTSQYAQRRLHSPTFKSWEFTEEWTLPVVLSQQESLAIMVVGSDPSSEPFTADDEWVPTATPLTVDESYWIAPQPASPQPVVRHFWFSDEVTQPEAPLGVEDEYWQVYTPEPPKPLVGVWLVEDEQPTPAVPLTVDDYGWLPIQPWTFNPPEVRPFVRPLAPFLMAGMEEEPIFQAPPPVVGGWRLVTALDLETGRVMKLWMFL